MKHLGTRYKYQKDVQKTKKNVGNGGINMLGKLHRKLSEVLNVSPTVNVLEYPENHVFYLRFKIHTLFNNTIKRVYGRSKLQIVRSSIR